MDNSLKILFLGDSLREDFPNKEELDNHTVTFLPVLSDISKISAKAPDIVVIDSSETANIERALKCMGQELFVSEPVFLIVQKEGSGSELESLLSTYRGADVIAEPLSGGVFTSKLEFLSGVVKARKENNVLREMVKQSRFAGHEINNPLTSIIGNTEMLLEEELDGMTRKMVDIVRREGIRIARLVEDMMESSRLDNM